MLGGFPVPKSTTPWWFQSDDTETLEFIASASFGTGIGTQLQSDARRLNRLLYRVYQVQGAPQGVEVRLVSELGREIFERLRGVVLTIVETPICEGLDETTEGVEQGGYEERRDHDGQLRLLLLAGERSEGCLGCSYTAEVDCARSGLRQAADQRAVYDDVYVVSRGREFRMNPVN
jgi:hypothetical protein